MSGRELPGIEFEVFYTTPDGKVWSEIVYAKTRRGAIGEAKRLLIPECTVLEGVPTNNGPEVPW